MRFQLKAVNAHGRVESFDLQGIDSASAVRQVEGRGYTVLTVRPRTWLAGSWRLGQARFPISMFSQELLVLLNAGLPLVEAIETLSERERRGDFKALLERICAIVRQGETLSSALGQFPHAFPPLYVATIQASEKTSDLGPALTRYINHQAQLDMIRKRVINAAIYPAVLVALGGMVSLFLLLYVVPRFSHIYEQRGADLPLFSRLLLYLGRPIEEHTGVVVAALAAVVVATAFSLAQASVRTRIANVLWRLPALGERLNVYQLARFYRTIGMLLQGGMPLITALHTGGAVLHPLLRVRLAAASRAISEGRTVSASMAEHGLTTPVALRLLVVGERSGSMGAMMERVAAFHDEEISRWIDWFARLFEPILMVLIGLVIGGIVILMYMPIFELAGSLQ